MLKEEEGYKNMHKKKTLNKEKRRLKRLKNNESQLSEDGENFFFKSDD